MADTHTVMSKKLAQALIESGVEHFDGGGIFGGLSDFLGTSNKYQATGPTAENVNYVPQIQTQQQRQSDVYGQQQNLANTLLQQSQGGGPNPAQAQLAQQTGNNIAQQGALIASQRGASANPGLLARQAALAGGNVQQQAVGQAATLQAQQQLQAQQALAAQQQAMQQAALQGESIEQGGLASKNNAALGVQQINANTAGQNAAGNRGLVGGLINSIGGAAGLFHDGGEVPKKMASGGTMGIENYGGSAPVIPMYQDPSNGSYGINIPAPRAINSERPYSPDDALIQKQGPETMLSATGGMNEMPMYAAKGGQIPFSQALLNGGKVPGKAEVKGNSEKNDKEPTLLSPGEIVLPRSVTQAPDMEKKAIEFLRHLKGKKKSGYGDVVAAKKACGGYA